MTDQSNAPKSRSFIPAVVFIFAVALGYFSITAFADSKSCCKENTSTQKESAMVLDGNTSNISAPTDSVKTSTKPAWNAVCPVMGDDVDTTLQTLEYKGKIWGVCCNMCIKKFMKNPEKYLQNVSEDGTKFINK